MLRSVSYGSLIASYIDVAESEDDRVEACSALVACFKSMADMTSHFVSLPTFTGVKETVVPREGTKRSSILEEQSKADKTITVHSGIVKKSGFDNQCGKILFNSDSNNRISRSSDSLKRGSCFSVSREIQKYKSDDSNIPTFTNSRGTCNVETTLSNGFMHRFGSMGPTAHETKSALSSSLVETSATQFKSFDSIVSTSSGTSVLVAKPKNFFQGLLLEQESAQVTLVTDASQSGWGAHINNYQIAGIWPPQYKVKHINWLELKAVQLALQTFLIKVHYKSVLVRTDNATVVSYLNKQGGTRSPELCYLAWDLLQWCINHNVKIQAVHIPGKKNIIADALSRGKMTIRLTEWALNMTIVNLLFLQLGTPVIDLFATSMNKKLPVFCSPWPGETAVSVDALSMKWTDIFAYAFPPPIILNRVLQKNRKRTVWCQERSINPSTSTVPEIAEFLMFLHTVKNCKPSTLAGYKSAIALIHSSKDKMSINMDLRHLIKGLYNINPPIRQLAPNWDLSLVLLVLTKTPFEPLEEAESKLLTIKTVFLVALASAARVSEINSFTINDKHFRKEQRSIRLLPNMQFLAKTKTLNKPWEPVFIPKFENYATDPNDLLLCHCRALLAYVKRTEVFANHKDFL
ncbi:unnamed protein product [Mytilus coruscus]|uniref:RNase H type-1 domain-containing protein n=1 Tax=Mytilus coruscus TaxID=42192 RepID=A0A6J8EUR9_MYTCO|nr:unnamed protein product [Mytilus coruscus]